MSNLGKVYEINIDREQKILYPVVYMNKTYLYCKEHGSDDLRKFRVPDRTHTISYTYEEFKKMYEEGNVEMNRYYTIYVPPYVKTFFEWIKVVTPLDKEIEKTQYKIDRYIYQMKECERSISSAAANIRKLQDLVIIEQEELKYLMNQKVDSDGTAQD